MLFRTLAKRLQHHERNRIRRIQTQYRKAAAVAAAATKLIVKNNMCLKENVYEEKNTKAENFLGKCLEIFIY